MSETFDYMDCPRCGGEASISSTNKPCERIQIECPWCGFMAVTSMIMMREDKLTSLREEVLDRGEVNSHLDFEKYIAKPEVKKRIKEFDEAYSKEYAENIIYP